MEPTGFHCKLTDILTDRFDRLSHEIQASWNLWYWQRRALYL